MKKHHKEIVGNSQLQIMCSVLIVEETDELLDKWSSEDTEMEYPDYLLKYASEKTKKYYIDRVNCRKKCWKNHFVIMSPKVGKSRLLAT